MPVTREEVLKVAALAKLSITEEEIEEFTRQFNEILEYFNKLNELDTTNVEPTSHVLDLKNVFREDAARPSLEAALTLTNGPDSDRGFFRVPKIIE